MNTLRSWYLAGTGVLVTRLAAVGVVAGVVSWIFALVSYSLLGAARPGVRELVLGVLLGALVGALLAFILAAYWDRSPGRRRGRGEGPGA